MRPARRRSRSLPVSEGGSQWALAGVEHAVGIEGALQRVEERLTAAVRSPDVDDRLQLGGSANEDDVPEDLRRTEPFDDGGLCRRIAIDAEEPRTDRRASDEGRAEALRYVGSAALQGCQRCCDVRR